MERPKKPRTEESRKRKEYLGKVAEIFGITPEKPFDGIFYFERIKELKNESEDPGIIKIGARRAARSA